MDFFEELEKMALNVVEESSQAETPSEETIHRWQKLFGYSYADVSVAALGRSRGCW
jgi:hypothetical protein